MKKKEKLIIKKYKNQLCACENKIGIRFRDKILLLEALSHKSYASSSHTEVNFFNERLEFLGDSILGTVITEYLFKKYPDKDEGKLTGIKSTLIRRETLADIAQELSLGEFLLFGESEQRMKTSKNISILANGLEALIGAYFLDKNFNKTKKFILSLFHNLLSKEFEDLPFFEYKNKLQEYTQAKQAKSPRYSITSASGPEHQKIFTAEVRLNGKVLGTGTGRSKKEAETEAAKDALEKLNEE